jgi:butyrate kinase
MVAERGVFGFAGTAALISAGQAMVGRKVYLEDNQTVGLASDTTNAIVAGILEEIDDTTFFVAVGLGEEYAGSVNGGDAANLADASVSPASTAGGVPVILSFTFPDVATATYDYVNTDKLEIVEVWAIKDAAGAGNTIQVKDSAAAAITDAMAFAVDKTVTRAATIDKAKRTLAAGAGFKITNTRAAGSAAGQLFILAIKRA